MSLHPLYFVYYELLFTFYVRLPQLVNRGRTSMLSELAENERKYSENLDPSLGI